MITEKYNQFCRSFAHTTHVVQWGSAHVWKVGGKVFAIGAPHAEGMVKISFKTSEIGFEVLRDTPGCIPAPYLASRGMKWIQRISDEGVGDDELQNYLSNSYRLVSLGLTKKLQKQLGLNQD